MTSIEDNILEILVWDYRPALTVREIKVETGVCGLGHQKSGYSLENIRRALAVLRKERKVLSFVRRLGKTQHTIMWSSTARLDRRGPDLAAAVMSGKVESPDDKICFALGILQYSRWQETKVLEGASAQETKARASGAGGAQETKAAAAAGRGGGFGAC